MWGARSVSAIVALVLALVVAVSPVTAITWAPIVRHGTAEDAFIAPGRGIATSGGVTHLSYNAKGAVRYRRSTDFGATWGAGVVLATDSSSAAYRSLGIASVGSTVVALYRAWNSSGGRYLFIRRSTNGGVTWNARQTIASYTSDRDMGFGAIAAGANGIFIVWTDRRSGDVRIRRSIDGGATFAAAQTIGTTTREFEPGQLDGWPEIAVSGARVLVSWSPENSSNPDLASRLTLRRSTDSGVTWKPEQTLVSVDAYDFPSIAISGTTVLGTWSLGDGRTIVARSTDGGANFTTRTIATSDSTYVFYAGDITLSGTVARFTYHRVEAAGDRLVIRSSPDGGVTWSGGTTVIPLEPKEKYNATVLVSSAATLVSVLAFPDIGPGVYTRRGAN